LRRWLVDYVDVHGSIASAARHLGVNENALRRIACVNSFVTVGMADRILAAAGEPAVLNDLYPVEGDA
jgi:plasmid maintenance system antidote protein VapI